MWPFKKKQPIPVMFYGAIKCSLLTNRSWCRFCKHIVKWSMMQLSDDGLHVEYTVKCHGEVDKMTLSAPVSKPMRHFHDPFDWFNYRFDT